jgi:hypothetical protein
MHGAVRQVRAPLPRRARVCILIQPPSRIPARSGIGDAGLTPGHVALPGRCQAAGAGAVPLTGLPWRATQSEADEAPPCPPGSLSSWTRAGTDTQRVIPGPEPSHGSSTFRPPRRPMFRILLERCTSGWAPSGPLWISYRTRASGGEEYPEICLCPYPRMSGGRILRSAPGLSGLGICGW